MPAAHAPVPDQLHISRQRLLHATIALDCFTTTFTDPCGFRPRTKRWLSDALPSQPLNWDRVRHWLYVTASCIAVSDTIIDLLLSYFGLGSDVLFYPLSIGCYLAFLLGLWRQPTYDGATAAMALEPSLAVLSFGYVCDSLSGLLSCCLFHHLSFAVDCNTSLVDSKQAAANATLALWTTVYDPLAGYPFLRAGPCTDAWSCICHRHVYSYVYGANGWAPQLADGACCSTFHLHPYGCMGSASCQAMLFSVHS